MTNYTQQQWRANHTSYRNFHFNEFIANTLRGNIGSKKSEENRPFFSFEYKKQGQGKPYNCTQSNTIAQSKLIWFLFCIKIPSHLEFYNQAQIAWFLVHDDNPQQTNIYLWCKIRGSLLLRSVLLLLLYYYLPACSRRNFVKDTGRRRSVATTNAMSFFLLSGLSVKILFILLLGIFLIASTRREDERFYV